MHIWDRLYIFNWYYADLVRALAKEGEAKLFMLIVIQLCFTKMGTDGDNYDRTWIT